MKRIFSSVGGCYHILGNDKGLYELDPPLSHANIPILINAAPTTRSDISSMVSCLENVKVIYSFGQDFGTIEIVGEVLLGPSGTINAGERILEDYFQKYRMSNYKKMVKLSSTSGNTKTPFFLISYSKGSVDPETHILPFTFSGVVVELDDQQSS